MANELRIRARADTRGAESDVERLKNRLLAMKKAGAGGILQGVGLAVGMAAFNALGGAVNRVGEFLGDSIRAASNLNETMNKSREVFGGSAASISLWGETAARAMGLSKRAAIEAAGNFGLFFQQAGKSASGAADMSKRMVELASDLTSFNNLDPTDALERLRSGLAGEAEPLRRVGVFLTAASVQAKAMEMGLVGAHGELSEGSKILARYELILEATKKAQGDFGRTAGEWANQQRTLNAELEDNEAQLGQKLLPLQKAWTALLTGTIGKLGDLVDALEHDDDAARIFAAGMEGGSEAVRALGFDTETAVEILSRAADRMEGMGGKGEEAAAKLRILAQALADEAAAAGEAEDAARKLGEGFEETAKKARTDRLYAFRDGLRKLRDAADDAKRTLLDLADEVFDKIYGPAIRAGRLEEFKQQLREYRDEQKLTTEGSADWIILAGKIAETRQSIDELRGEQAKAAGDTTYFAWIDKQIARLGLVGAAAVTYRKKLDALYAKILAAPSLSTTFRFSSTTSGPLEFQHGGPVQAGRSILVGEAGPELFRPSSSGTIIPHHLLPPARGTSGLPAQAAAAAGQPVVIRLQLDGRTLAEVVDRHLYYMRPAGPARFPR